MLDVADRSELIVARNAQILFVCLCTIHVSVASRLIRVCFQLSLSDPFFVLSIVLNTSVS